MRGDRKPWRDWYRNGDEFNPEYEAYETAAKLLGIDLTEERKNTRTGKYYTANTIQWSGFSSQGDGASFTGDFTFVPGCCDTIRAEFPTITALHTIADKLTTLHNRLRLLKGERLTGKITRSDSHYCHKYTMDATAYDSEGEELEIAISDEFRDLMRDFAQWIYDGLEEGYDYQMSDESVDESIESNDYEFDEDGEPA